MNVSCDVITDLLPLYHDEVCNEASRKLVEEHLAQCDSCAAMLKQMKNNAFDTHMTQERENVARHHTKAIKRKSLFAGISIVIIPIVIAILTVFLWPLSFSNHIPDEVEMLVSITESDGYRRVSRQYRFQSDSEVLIQIREVLDGYSFRRSFWTFFTPERSVGDRVARNRPDGYSTSLALSALCPTGRYASSLIYLPGTASEIIVGGRFYRMSSNAEAAMKAELLSILDTANPR